jgi:hypothetical protein
MRRSFVFLVIGAMLFSGNVPVFADAPDRVLTADDQVWAGSGTPNPATTDVLEAGQGNNVDLDDHVLIITNDATADDGSGD